MVTSQSLDGHVARSDGHVTESDGHVPGSGWSRHRVRWSRHRIRWPRHRSVPQDPTAHRCSLVRLEECMALAVSGGGFGG
eukprot:58373-Rhodomonas_salina.1